MAKATKYVEEFEDRHGLISPFLGKFEFEDREDFDYSVYIDSESESESEDEEIPDLHQRVKRYIRQIRESFGFDVDCCVPSWFNWPFTPFDLSKIKTSGSGLYDLIMEAVECVIREINDEKRNDEKRYEMVEAEKVVLTINVFMLATIKVKEFAVNANDDDDAVFRTIQAFVYVPPGGGGDPIVEQWKFKPDIVEQAEQQA